jgi:hypothetical protein
MVHNILGHSSKFIETTAKNKKTKFFSENITEIGRNALKSSFGDCFALQLMDANNLLALTFKIN